MAIDIILSPDRVNNPIEQARRTFLKALAAIKTPTIGSWPEPDDFLAVKDHIAEVAAIADQWLRAVGTEVRCNTSENLNMSFFESAFTDAFEGWASFEITRAAEALAEDLV
jgi:hypothetical protein